MHLNKHNMKSNTHGCLHWLGTFLARNSYMVISFFIESAATINETTTKNFINQSNNRHSVDDDC